jgi:hypothetical protein
MRPVKFTANVAKFTARAPEEGGASTVAIALKFNKPDRKALSALCEKPEEALKALDAVLDANGKTEIPCGKEICSMTAGSGTKTHEVTEAGFKKVVLDARGGECQMGVILQEPKTVEGINFYARMLGADVDFAAAPQQKTIDDEVEEKKGKKGAE